MFQFQVEKVKDTEWRLMQSRYLLDPSVESQSASSPYDYKWEIPITYTTSGDPTSRSQKWMSSTDPFVLVNAQSGTDWIKFNVGQYGFYRVNYPESEWAQFAQLLMKSHEVNTIKSTYSHVPIYSTVTLNYFWRYFRLFLVLNCDLLACLMPHQNKH